MKTVAEAKKLNCPLMLAAGRAFCNCEGDKCMAWQWLGQVPLARVQLATQYKALTEAEAGGVLGTGEPPLPQFEFHPYDAAEEGEAAWVESEASRMARREGGCGLVHTADIKINCMFPHGNTI